MPKRLPKHLFDAQTAARLAREFSAGLSLDLPVLEQRLANEFAEQPLP